jgi:hypothetical protein
VRSGLWGCPGPDFSGPVRSGQAPDFNRLLPRAGLMGGYRGRSHTTRVRHPRHATRLSAEAVTFGMTLRSCRVGRSSDWRTWALRPAYWPCFPAPPGPVHVGLSFPLTAAGQFRVHTGFPLATIRTSSRAATDGTQHIGAGRSGQHNNLWISQWISGGKPAGVRPRGIRDFLARPALRDDGNRARQPHRDMSVPGVGGRRPYGRVRCAEAEGNGRRGVHG